jgi:predicted RecA/RadA family phage recombinase
MTNFVQKGETITVTAPYNVSSGGGVLVGSQFGVAANDATSGATDLEIATVGVFNIAKTSALQISAGDVLYWNDTTKVLTKTTSDVGPVAVAVADAANPSATVSARLTAGYSAPLDASILRYTTVEVSNAEIKALRATPKELVAAPGANKFLEFVSAVLVNNGGANALTESADNMAVKYVDGSGAVASQTIEATGFIDQTAKTITNALPKIDAIVASASGANKALVLHNTGDGEYAGNAAADVTLSIKVAYRVHSV